MDYKSTSDMSVAERLVADLLGPPPAEDGLPKGGPLEVQVHGEQWLPVSTEIWRAWTGPRRVWGIEYHGPVFPLGAADESKPYDGARVCRCRQCQEHVHPTARPN